MEKWRDKADIRKKILRFISAGVLTVLVTMQAGGCSRLETDQSRDIAETEEGSSIAPEKEQKIRYEAEEAELSGNVHIERTDEYPEKEYVTGFTEDGDAVSFSIEVLEEGVYDLVFMAAGIGGLKYNTVLLDDENEGQLITDESEEFVRSVLKKVYLREGNHKVTLQKEWGWLSVDSLLLERTQEPDAEIYEADITPADQNADVCVIRTMEYLGSIYGRQTLSGQYCLSGPAGPEMEIIREISGEEPAILAMDMMFYSNSATAYVTEPEVVEWAEQYWEKGGLISLSWHWFVPERYKLGEWWQAYGSSDNNMDLEAVLNGNDREGYELLMEDMDTIAACLKRLQKKGIPVLWRPLHEGSGGWFWWGSAGPECYKRLWQIMFDKFTKEYELHNLIWVYSGMAGEWYPGDEYVDIIGEDIYPGRQCYSAQGDKFINALEYTDSGKMIMLSEIGALPDPDKMSRDGIWWLGCIVWGEQYLMNDEGEPSEDYINEEQLRKFYQHEDVVTLKELPDLFE